MVKLTNTQATVLLTALRRNDGAITLPERLRGAAAAKFAHGQIGKSLAKEIRARAGMTMWRRDEAERAFALVITRLGRKAIQGLEESRTGEPLASEHWRTVRITQVKGRVSSARQPPHLPDRRGPGPNRRC